MQERGLNGTLKTISVGTVFRVFYRWSEMTHDDTLAELAQRVAQAGRKH